MFKQRRAVRHPAAAGEPILLPIDRHMVGILGGHDLGRDAGVVAISFDQRIFRPRRLSYAALGVLRAGVLRILRHPHPQLGPLELQRLRHVVADELFGPCSAQCCSSAATSAMTSYRGRCSGSCSFRGFRG